MRKELDNSYLAEVNESGKFLGKNKLNVHGGGSNVVSNVTDTILGGVSITYNPNGLVSIQDEEHNVKNDSRIVPAGTLVIINDDWAHENKKSFTFGTFSVGMGGLNGWLDKNGDMMEVDNFESFVGFLVNDVDFTNTDIVNNVAIAQSCKINTKELSNLLFNKLPINNEGGLLNDYKRNFESIYMKLANSVFSITIQREI